MWTKIVHKYCHDYSKIVQHKIVTRVETMSFKYNFFSVFLLAYPDGHVVIQHTGYDYINNVCFLYSLFTSIN